MGVNSPINLKPDVVFLFRIGRKMKLAKSVDLGSYAQSFVAAFLSEKVENSVFGTEVICFVWSQCLSVSAAENVE